MRRDTKTTQRGRALELVLSLVVATASSGCLQGALSQGNAAQPHLDTKVFPVSCDDGRRYAARTLKVRSYKITGVERGAGQTTVSGRNEGEKVNGSVTVTCQGDGVTVVTDGPTLWVRDGLR